MYWPQPQPQVLSPRSVSVCCQLIYRALMWSLCVGYLSWSCLGYIVSVFAQCWPGIRVRTGLYSCTVVCTVQSTVQSGLQQHCSHSRLGREAVRAGVEGSLQSSKFETLGRLSSRQSAQKLHQWDETRGLGGREERGITVETVITTRGPGCNKWLEVRPAFSIDSLVF